MEETEPDTYVAIKKVEDEPYDLCFIFCHPWPRNLFVGLYLPSSSTMFLRDTMSRYPCIISLRIVNALALIGISTNFSRLQGDYSGGKLTDTKNPEVLKEVSNGAVLKMANEMFERFKELIDEINE